MGGRRGIWEVWFPELGRIRVFGGEPEPGFVDELIGGLIGGLPLCLFGGSIWRGFFFHRSTIYETAVFFDWSASFVQTMMVCVEVSKLS